MRRIVLSGLFVLHFGGISTAALAAPPSPWIVTQSWLRVYRPYLEFLYLNNAYHFYAPDPGPSSFLWFRIIYTDGKNDFGKWYKLPEMEPDGRIKHPVSLEYQRYLAMTESIAPKDSLPPEFYFDKREQKYLPQPMYANRLKLAEPGAPVVIAGVPVSPHPRIPLHPNMSPASQVNIPATPSKYLISSFARHIAFKFPTHVDEQGNKLVFKSVKIYRVIHQIPPISWYQYRMSPTDPVLYQPYFMGNYLHDGSQLIDGDPYLYWLLPILRERANDPDSKVLDYCRKHAGDADWQMERTKWK